MYFTLVYNKSLSLWRRRWMKYERMTILSAKKAQLSPLLRHSANDLQKRVLVNLLKADRKRF